MVQFGNTALANDILANYRAATRISPVSAQKRNQIFTDYGATPGWSVGKSDALISNEAARLVLARFQAEKERAAKAEADRIAAAAAAQEAAAARAEAARQQAAQQQAAQQAQAAAQAAAQQTAQAASGSAPAPAYQSAGSWQSGGTSGGPISVDRAIQIKAEYGRTDIMLGGEGTAWREQIMSSEAAFRAWLEGAIAANPVPAPTPAPAPTPTPAYTYGSYSSYLGPEATTPTPAPAPAPTSTTYGTYSYLEPYTPQPYTSYYTYSYLQPAPAPTTTYRVPISTVARVI